MSFVVSPSNLGIPGSSSTQRFSGRRQDPRTNFACLGTTGDAICQEYVGSGISAQYAYNHMWHGIVDQLPGMADLLEVAFMGMSLQVPDLFSDVHNGNCNLVVMRLLSYQSWGSLCHVCTLLSS